MGESNRGTRGGREGWRMRPKMEDGGVLMSVEKLLLLGVFVKSQQETVALERYLEFLNILLCKSSKNVCWNGKKGAILTVTENSGKCKIKCID